MHRIEHSETRIIATIEAGIGTLSVANEAKRNAVTLSMWSALGDLAASLDADDAVRVIVLTGAGSTFVSGADISEFDTVRADGAGARAYEAENERAFAALRGAKKPTIAAIRGHCFGGGLGLAASCDLRIAEEGSKFCLPAAKLGIGYPPEAMADLVSILGAASAKDIAFTARVFEAGEAFRLGFLDRLVEPGGLEAAANALAGAMTALAPLSQQAAKAAINAARADAPENAAALARQRADLCFDSADYAEGRAAFLEKRPARFTGA
ncbi:MAG: enoyl-CoA hydratase/isomerase family protein [Hyphomicrobiaceae bacterium]|nr:enoyl-CoA hydratase/isomerase family protein [Hyphomicrobiaceae bacterium]